ncbi:MAG: DUF1036 domain-containing protein, partial [Pseudomonadota bacterium]
MIALVFGIGLTVGGGKAAAQYSFCNKTSYALSASVGYTAHEDLVTRGWWRLRPGECKRVLSEAVTPGRYYVYAEAIPGHRGELRTWSGQTPLCVQNDSLFTLRDQNICTDDPRRRREFMPVDVPEGTKGTWTTEFSDENNFSVFDAKVAGVQRLLKDIGAFEGRIDGDLGAVTTRAVRRYQQSKGLGRGGRIDDALIDMLIAEANKVDSQLGFFYCNATMLPVWAAIAQPNDQAKDANDKGNYTASGWWRLESQECAKIRRGALSGNTYYVYGVMEAENR